MHRAGFEPGTSRTVAQVVESLLKERIVRVFFNKERQHS